MPPRRSTTSEAPSATDAGDLSTLSLPPDLQDADVSILSTTSSTSKTGKANGASKKERAEGDASGEKEKEKEKEKDTVGIEDLLLPRTLLNRLARGVLPPNTSISKDALLAITKASSVFISHLASTADSLTTKKTISPQDVLTALEEIEWGHLRGKCEGELKIWEDVSKGKRRGYRERVKARESGVSVATSAGGEAGDQDETEERAGKRPKVDDIFLQYAAQPQSSSPLQQQNGTSQSVPPSSSNQHPPHPHPHLQQDHPMADHDPEDPDETQPEEAEADPEDDDDEDPEAPSSESSSEEEQDDEDEDGYGPDAQLRRDIILNGGGGGSGAGAGMGVDGDTGDEDDSD